MRTRGRQGRNLPGRISRARALAMTLAMVVLPVSTAGAVTGGPALDVGHTNPGPVAPVSFGGGYPLDEAVETVGGIVCGVEALATLLCEVKEAWVSRYDGPGTAVGSLNDHARAMGVSPDGSRLYVTGQSQGDGTGFDYATVAYDATDGSELWVARHDEGGLQDEAVALAVSPDGSRVFVTGYGQPQPGVSTYVTIAYEASSGSQLWISRYAGPAPHSADRPYGLRLSPDGSRLFVTGRSRGDGTDADYATVAYAANDGSELWVARYDGPGNDTDRAYSLIVSPDGGRVFVTGTSRNELGEPNCIPRPPPLPPNCSVPFEMAVATIAYDADDGTELWVSRYDGPIDVGVAEFGSGLELNADGSRLFVFGLSAHDFVTLAYSTADGSEVWNARYDHGFEGIFAIGQDTVRLSPDGSRLFVTGTSSVDGDSDIVTVAYDAADGMELWVARYDGPGGGLDWGLSGMVLSPDGSTLFVAGLSEGVDSDRDYVTLAYDASTGDEVFALRYDGPGNARDSAHAITLSPDGSRLFVTGESRGGDEVGDDYATIAYELFSALAMPT